MKVEVQKEHHWLQKLVGEWTYETESVMEPGKPPQKFTGTESVRPLGDIWMLFWGHGEMPGGGMATTLITLGYDPQKKRYVGTWIGSMMTYLWISDGTLDSTEKILTLYSEGPSMSAEGKMATYKDVIELKNENHRILRASVLGEDGMWHEFMTTHYRRKER